MLEAVLRWGHLVPTAPDTLTAYAFSDNDPFILADAPHVLFAGNQPAFATRLVEGAPACFVCFCLLRPHGILAACTLQGSVFYCCFLCCGFWTKSLHAWHI
jgi:hypothetical protein